MARDLASLTHPPTQVGLLLDWSNMGKQHLNWLLPRIPQTKDLSLVRFHSLKDQTEYKSFQLGGSGVQHDRLCPQHMQLSFATGAKNLSCFQLLLVKTPIYNFYINQELNLSFVANLTDAAIHKLLSAPRDSRPGLRNTNALLLKPYRLISTSTFVKFERF